MEYYFNQLDPVTFQRLINAILLARFGEDLRITPLRGRDGGRDCETAPLNPYFEFQVGSEPSLPRELLSSIRPGRYLFQVKHHRTSEGKLADIRNTVISDFASELRSNVLSREGDERVNYFFLVTNVPTSEKALADIDRVRSKLLRATEALHADIWWQEQVVAYLDQLPSLWNAFPALFAGNQPPLIAKVAVDVNTGLPRAVRLALNRQYDLDLSVKFRQIELEQSLSKLYVDLDVGIGHLKEEDQQELLRTDLLSEQSVRGSDTEDELILSNAQFAATRRTRSRAQVKALTLLLREPRNSSMRKVILQGGPGQGKSTITQMLAQIHRQEILRRTSLLAEGRWSLPQKVRLPFRIELRKFADWLNKTQYGSVEEYLATVLRTDSGGAEIGVNDIHELLEKSRVLLIFDGLDEVGSDSLRDEVITAITECTGRLEHGLNTDLQVIITTRPPAMIGQRDRLAEFWQFSIAPMDVRRIRSYVSRWLSVQIRDDSEKKRIRESFQRRQDEPHVDALAKNPMQLSVLLQFIRLKGEAFPDRRAELYRDYFQIVIDRDVEKSPDLAANRRKIEALHEFLGYNIHTLTEVDQANRTLDRKTLLRMTGTWLQARGGDAQAANHFFRLGEERFGLIVASAGEGEETRYGFEIQPVQEYFAAAYISNQIPPDSAHAVFEALIRRPFWREVGLFLAGLRRPNEKADLIARARRLDQDETLGWRQDGRAMILQLLQEGVFSEPPYVFTQALDFLVDLIDSNSLRVQNEPKSMLDGLCDLVGRGTSRDFRRRVMALLPQYRDSQDEYSLYRLYRFAAKVISTDELLDEILTRQHDRPDLAAKLRLEWPMTWGIDLRAATARTGYWTVASERVWAETWWRTAMRSGSVPDLPAPPSLHQCLLEQFAIDPIRVGRYTRRRFPIIRSASNWAVWQLLSLQQLLNHQYAIIRLDSIHPTMVMDAVSQVLDHGKSVSFAGLETASRMALEDLITLSSHLVAALPLDDIDFQRTALREYRQGIASYLERPGLPSWLASRCGIGLVQMALAYELGRTQLNRPTADVLNLNGEWSDLISSLQPYYPELSTLISDSESEDVVLASFSGSISVSQLLHRLDGATTPKCVLLSTSAPPTSVVELLAQSISHGQAPPFEWLNGVSLSREWLRPLLDMCRENLSDLLFWLARRRLVDDNSSSRLTLQDMQRILKLARTSEDDDVVAGALVALAGSRYIRLARPELIEKLIHAAAFRNRLGPSLFRMGEAAQLSLFADQEAKAVRDEIAIARDVAKLIVAAPDRHDLRTICAAAGFLAEEEQVSLPPLHAEEDKLGIAL